MGGFRTIGARVERSEDPRLLTGRGEFIDDIHLPGLVHAAFVRSSFAHAKIKSVNASAAERMPGVIAVIAADRLPPGLRDKRLPMLLPNPALIATMTQAPLARDEVTFVGEAIAVVVAESRYVAEDAAAMVEVDCDPLPAASDCRDAVKPGAPVAHSAMPDNKAAVFKVGYGDIDAAFRNAAHTFKEELWHHRGVSHAIECRGVLADYGERNRVLTVWS